MAADGYWHDLISYGSMIKGFMKARQTKKIAEYARLMQQEGVRLDYMFVKTLFSNKNEDVNFAMDELKKNGMYVTDSVIQRIEKAYSNENGNNQIQNKNSWKRE
mmetsp:Transcript_57009/g.124021  ORF Transcript_57009/g.124021 Transcript_57009/m.124021 type:complete len:104 (-) Transcript_57009:145-456(-)